MEKIKRKYHQGRNIAKWKKMALVLVALLVILVYCMHLQFFEKETRQINEKDHAVVSVQSADSGKNSVRKFYEWFVSGNKSTKNKSDRDYARIVKKKADFLRRYSTSVDENAKERNVIDYEQRRAEYLGIKPFDPAPASKRSGAAGKLSFVDVDTGRIHKKKSSKLYEDDIAGDVQLWEMMEVAEDGRSVAIKLLCVSDPNLNNLPDGIILKQPIPDDWKVSCCNREYGYSNNETGGNCVKTMLLSPTDLTGIILETTIVPISNKIASLQDKLPPAFAVYSNSDDVPNTVYAKQVN